MVVLADVPFPFLFVLISSSSFDGYGLSILRSEWLIFPVPSWGINRGFTDFPGIDTIWVEFCFPLVSHRFCIFIFYFLKAGEPEWLIVCFGGRVWAGNSRKAVGYSISWIESCGCILAALAIFFWDIWWVRVLTKEWWDELVERELRSILAYTPKNSARSLKAKENLGGKYLFCSIR